MTSRCDYECAEIIDDSDDDNGKVNDDNGKDNERHVGNGGIRDLSSTNEVPQNPPTRSRTRTRKTVVPCAPLKVNWTGDEHVVEIGVDEVGRGPLLGRVYTAAVILPKDGSFDGTRVKDSKKFHSKKKIEEAYNYIKTHALAYSVDFQDEQTIDRINILQATQQSMHQSIHKVMTAYSERDPARAWNVHLLVDGNYFNPMTRLNRKKGTIETIPYTTLEGGDGKSAAIAAASILAKVERDRYIEELCHANPSLTEKYGIDSNKGYGTKKHMEGIKEHGITIWHRRSFAPCKSYVSG